MAINGRHSLPYGYPLIVDKNLPPVQEFDQSLKARNQLKCRFEHSCLLVTLSHFCGNLEYIPNTVLIKHRYLLELQSGYQGPFSFGGPPFEFVGDCMLGLVTDGCCMLG